MTDNIRARLSRSRLDAAIFDLDGVITRTARLHARAWKRMFDEYLIERSRSEGKAHAPFDIESDYRHYVDGKPRYDGVQSFLDARAITLPRGDPRDPPGTATVCGLGNRKDMLFQELLEREGVELYEHAVDLVKRLRSAGFKTAVVSSSKNCVPVLRSVQALELFDAKVDGVDAELRGLKGKPNADIFLAAAQALRVEPKRTAVLEDAQAGVAAGRAGGFGLVVGVDRANQAKELRAQGADLVVTDLAALETSACAADALENLAEIGERLRGRGLAVFLDFDGTLAPIVDRPEHAAIDSAMRDAVTRLARLCPLAVISGRDMHDVRQRVGIDGIHYAGSHGFEIRAPNGAHYEHPKGVEALPTLDAAERALRAVLRSVDGALVERKRFSIAAHYRLVRAPDVPKVEDAVDGVLRENADLRKGHGKKVFELRPNVNWDKGAAVNWLLQALNLDRPDVLALYVGDDETDEDAFRALADRGLGIAVLDRPRPTAAHYCLRDPAEVRIFLERLAEELEHRG